MKSFIIGYKIKVDLKDLDKAFNYYQKAKRIGRDVNTIVKAMENPKKQVTLEDELRLIPERVKKQEVKTPEDLLGLKFEKPKKVKPAPEQLDLLGRMQKKLM